MQNPKSPIEIETYNGFTITLTPAKQFAATHDDITIWSESYVELINKIDKTFEEVKKRRKPLHIPVLRMDHTAGVATLHRDILRGIHAGKKEYRFESGASTSASSTLMIQVTPATQNIINGMIEELAAIQEHERIALTGRRVMREKFQQYGISHSHIPWNTTAETVGLREAELAAALAAGAAKAATEKEQQ